MNRKIEIIQDEENLEEWHWIILEYSTEDSQWYNIGHGLETSYDEACCKAKKEYDSKIL